MEFISATDRVNAAFATLQTELVRKFQNFAIFELYSWKTLLAFWCKNSSEDYSRNIFQTILFFQREIRTQDISLMKQLLSINDSIQRLSKKKSDKSRARRMTRKISRKPTLAEIEDEDQTFSRKDEITLLTNIKLWKYSQSDESSSGSESEVLSE